VLGGSLRKAANQVRITGQLTDAVWADRFDGGLGASFDTLEHDTQVVHAGICSIDRIGLGI
jgi:TolB-like protein